MSSAPTEDWQCRARYTFLGRLFWNCDSDNRYLTRGLLTLGSIYTKNLVVSKIVLDSNLSRGDLLKLALVLSCSHISFCQINTQWRNYCHSAPHPAEAIPIQCPRPILHKGLDLGVDGLRNTSHFSGNGYVDTEAVFTHAK